MNGQRIIRSVCCSSLLLLLFSINTPVAIGAGKLQEQSTETKESQNYTPSSRRSSQLLVLGSPDTPGLVEHVERMNNPPAYLKWGNLGAQYFKAGEYDKAIAAYREELRLTRGSSFEGAPRDRIVRVYEVIGDYASAAKEMEGYIEVADQAHSDDITSTYSTTRRPELIEHLSMLQMAADGQYDLAITHANNLQKAELQTFHARKYPSRRQEILDEWQPRIQALEERARAAGQVTAASQKNIVPE